MAEEPKLYCYVKDGKVLIEPRTLPHSWKNISGLHLMSDADLAKIGWLLYVNEPLECDQDTQYLTSERVIDATTVTESYTVNDYTPQEMESRIVALKETRKKEIRAECEAVNYSYYPIWHQTNVANGIYGADVGDPMKAHIAAVLSESNRCEDLVDAPETDTMEKIRGIVPSWPSKPEE